MRIAGQAPAERNDIIGFIRAARFANGLVCVRCTSACVIRWGGFSGRHRYRCKACRRTFSDLTYTPAYYSKRITRWPTYALAMLQGDSVRRSAASAAIQPSTSFRWRHALLAGVRQTEDTMLVGAVAFSDTRFPYSDKGAHNPRPRAQRRELPGDSAEHGIVVVFARDNNGYVASGIAGRLHIVGDTLMEEIAPRVARGSLIINHLGPMSPFKRLAHASGGRLVTVRRHQTDGPHNCASVLALIRRYRKWLMRFKGVATRYVPNYLMWHRVVDRRLEWLEVVPEAAWVLAERLLEWPARPVESARLQDLAGHHQQFPGTEPHAARIELGMPPPAAPHLPTR